MRSPNEYFRGRSKHDTFPGGRRRPPGFFHKTGLRNDKLCREPISDFTHGPLAPATLALAWVMAQPGIIAPIASATSVEQLKALVEAAKLNLDQPARDLLDKASAEPAVASEAGTAA